MILFAAFFTTTCSTSGFDMPFVIFCGPPCSGKSKRCMELKSFITSNYKREVIVISDDVTGVPKNEIYADSKKEKETRSGLKSAVQRKITKDNVVLVDSMNYIKGFRYELFCVTKSAQSPHCVIYCDVSKENATKWNSGRPQQEQYTQDVLDALMMRMEPPDSRNRWDSPLFTIQYDDELPCQQICDAIFQRKAPSQNMSTQSQPLSSTDFLYELDRITQATVSVIIDSQKTGIVGDAITVPGADEKVRILRHISLAELQRHKRQFIKFTKMHPTSDISKLSNMFVQYLNNSIT
ncbi:unnamed protein product [Owenia fusiformis]|uniref:Protein KTI12 homolog n=1 Tax=Owenia fusiformis TaxID=6347 RepID=A0A8S4P805_OWEFU|nr:unnamed protein product [Owenia fusiformis]